MSKSEHEVIICDSCGEIFIVPNGDNKYYNCFEISKAVSHKNIDSLTEDDYTFPQMVTLANLEGRRYIFKCNEGDILGTDTEKEGHAIAPTNKNYCQSCAKIYVPKYLELVAQLNEFFDSINSSQ